MNDIIFNPILKLLYHGDRVKKWLEGDDIFPILVEIAPTGYCNADCPFCFFKSKRNNSQINKDVMIKTLRELSNNGIKAINWTGGGEPTLHPNFSEFVEVAYSVGLKQGLFTNAYQEIPNQNIFDWIRITLTDKEFDIIKIPKVFFGICVNQTQDNTEDQINKWCIKAKEIGASYFQIRPALIGNYIDQQKLLIPMIKKHQTKNFKVYLTLYKYIKSTIKKKYNKCYGHYFSPSINWNGKLGTCLYMVNDSKYVFGDLNVDSFSSIWKKRIISDDLVTDLCQNCCKCSEINDILFKAKELKHVDFI